ncbi:response regulator transcription factor [Massilia terrae]|uniref:Response regulator transcription factor n=1 Tax=Massilia terrae TaxID=1811224 RepID=A0ABT2CYF5_9BURK|nr:response regulator transcription factor [Massilia terrae]MCS0659010.1 response regulator transcription factor [Massilia terrae]
MTRVGLASSISLLREGMKRIISWHDDLTVAGEYTCFEELCFHEPSNGEEVLVIANPFGALNETILAAIRHRLPACQLIMIGHRDAMKHGLNGFASEVRGLLTNDCSPESLPDAIRTVAAGRVYVNESVSELFANDAKLLKTARHHANLTKREFEILAQLCQGKKCTNIGAELGISVKTVSTYKARILEKIGMSSVPELIQYAMSIGLLEDPSRQLAAADCTDLAH